MVSKPVASVVEALPGNGARRALIFRDYGIIGILILLALLLVVGSPSFLTPANLSAVLDSAAVPGIAACGVTLAIVSGAFDLSLGAVYSVGGILAVMLSTQLGTGPAEVAAVIAGVFLGVVNGFLIATLEINSFIATLATSFVFGGLAIVITGGVYTSTKAAGFGFLGSITSVGGISAATWVFLGVAVATAIVLHWSGYGQTLFAIGGNREAARLSGIRVRANQAIALALSGGCAAIAGIIDASRTGAASSDSGAAGTLALSAIAATIIGGTSIMGGEGAIWRAVAGVLILALMADAFNLLGISGNIQNIVEGALILIAVFIDIALRQRR